MKKNISDSLEWEDDFDRKKKKKSSVKKRINYIRKDKYKKDYLNDEY